MAKAKLFFFLIFLCLFLTNCDDSIDCTVYHQGKFEIVDDTRDVLIERDKEFQIETVRSTGIFSKYRIIWTNPCTYRLFFLEGPEPIYEAWHNNYLEVMILEGTESEYSFKAVFSKSGKSETGVVKKLNAI